MFTRNQESYAISEDAIARILRDDASTIRRIGEIIPDGSKVLDVGAGNGILSRVLLEMKKSVLIDGIEPNEFAASIAYSFYREMYVGYAEEFHERIKVGFYDYVVMADVVEHTENPAEFLEKILDCIDNKTKLIISLPNVAFGGQRINLLNGIFKYVDSGLLEKTHLRFFTLASAKELFLSLSLGCHSIAYLGRSFYRVEFSRESLKASLFQIMRLAFLREARAYQYLFTVSKSANDPPNESYYGLGPFQIILDAIFYRPYFKKLALYAIQLRNR
ncbi:class I SAM-dependent methyltransferase [Polynucleobacter paneuropaeus]|nr:class I SAM-dependent methyltransferase [Polynucleobacter paneuropaeus]